MPAAVAALAEAVGPQPSGMWADLLDRLPIAALIIDSAQDGERIRGLNDHAVRLFGYDRSEVIGALVELLVNGATGTGSTPIRDCRVGARGGPEEALPCKLVWRRRDGSFFLGDVFVHARHERDAIVVIVVARDGTDPRSEARPAGTTSAPSAGEAIPPPIMSVPRARAPPRLSEMFSAIAVGIFVHADTGEIIEANAAAQSILRLGRDQILKGHYPDANWSMIHENGTPIPSLRSLTEAGVLSDRPVWNSIIGIRGTDFSPRWISVSCRRMGEDADVTGAAFVTSLVDITERKQLEVRVSASAREIEDLYEHAPCGYHSLDSNGTYLRIDATELDWVGCRREDVVGKLRVTDFFTEDGRATFRRCYPEFLRTGRIDGHEYELVGRNGLRRRVVLSASVVRDSSGRFVLCRGVMFDVAEQRRLEHALLHATSGEQHRLGRDLHDGLGQELTGISLLASGIASSERRAGRPSADERDKLAALARRAIANCRSLSHGLSPVSFSAGGFLGALREMVMLQRDAFGLDARLEVSDEAPLELALDTLDNLFRIAQEAVSNARRHGNARSIYIKLRIEPTGVRLQVLDDGIGFASPTAGSTGMGLKIMKFRATIIGADLSIGPGDHGGTLVTVACTQP